MIFLLEIAMAVCFMASAWLTAKHPALATVASALGFILLAVRDRHRDRELVRVALARPDWMGKDFVFAVEHEGRLVVKMGRDGRMWMAPGCRADVVARLFWQAVQAGAIHQKPRPAASDVN